MSHPRTAVHPPKVPVSPAKEQLIAITPLVIKEDRGGPALPHCQPVEACEQWARQHPPAHQGPRPANPAGTGRKEINGSLVQGIVPEMRGLWPCHHLRRGAVLVLGGSGNWKKVCGHDRSGTQGERRLCP
jgi:hypothetical protein